MFTVASFFCGCGGSDLGTLGGFSFLGREYTPLPFDISYCVDFDQPAVNTYNANFTHHAVCRDIVLVNQESEIPSVDVLIGGFPCQSFSTVNPTKNVNDDRAQLYKQIVKFLGLKRPKAFVCENVKGLLTLQKGAIITKIVREFSDQGYAVKFLLLNAADYGVPQKRERVIMVGIREDIGYEYLFPYPSNSQSSWVPLSSVIDKLDIDDEKYYFSKKAVRGMKQAKNNMKRGLWQDLSQPCLTITSHLAKVSINSRDPVLLVDERREIYRRFTPREAARIQSFPDDFVFVGSDALAYKQIGNAVPPVLMWHVMNQLAKVLSNESVEGLQGHDLQSRQLSISLC